MKTPFTNRWIALDALGPEDEDAELRDYVSVDLDEPAAPQVEEGAVCQWRPGMARPALSWPELLPLLLGGADTA